MSMDEAASASLSILLWPFATSVASAILSHAQPRVFKPQSGFTHKRPQECF